MLASSAWATPAQALDVCPNGQGCVQVELMGGAQDEQVVQTDIVAASRVSPQSDLHDVESGNFPMRPNPTDEDKSHSAGVSVATVIEDALGEATATTVTRAVVVRQDGGSQDQLDKTDLQPPGTAGSDYPFPGIPGDPHPAPMFYLDGLDVVQYGRSLRADPADTNYVQDTTYNSYSAPLVVRVYVDHSPVVVTPIVEATPTDVKLGQAISFRVSSFDGTQPDEQLRYFWDFGDGPAVTDCDQTASGSGDAVSHTYAAEGTYDDVTVTVCGAHTSGRSDPITVTVGPKSKPTKNPAPPGGNGATDNPTDGPDSGPNDSDGKHKGGTPSSEDGPGGAGKASERGTTGDRAKQQDAAAGTKNLQLGIGGETVTGVLLDADAARSVQVDAPAAAPVAAARSRRATELPRDWRWLLALVPLALLVGGGARQTPWLAGRLPRPPWRDV